MPLYARFDRVASAAGGAFAVSIAQDRSSCGDGSLFPQQVVSVADRSARPLGALAVGGTADALAAAADAPVAVLVGGMRAGQIPVRVVDFVSGEVLADRSVPDRFHGVAVDGTGDRAAFVMTDRVAITEARTGREIASVPFATGRRFGAYVAWVRGGWVMAHAQNKKWALVPLSPEGAPAGAEIPIRGEPFDLAGASAARVVAAGIGKKIVQVVDLDSGAVVSVTPHSAKDAYAAVTVAVSDDGARVFSRGTEDADLWVLARGAAEARPFVPLATTRTRAGKIDFVNTPAFAVCGATLVTVLEGVPAFHPLGDDTAPVAGAWGPPAKGARKAKR